MIFQSESVPFFGQQLEKIFAGDLFHDASKVVSTCVMGRAVAGAAESFSDRDLKNLIRRP
jgi:hypothetical protein